MMDGKAALRVVLTRLNKFLKAAAKKGAKQTSQGEGEEDEEDSDESSRNKSLTIQKSILRFGRVTTSPKWRIAQADTSSRTCERETTSAGGCEEQARFKNRQAGKSSRHGSIGTAAFAKSRT